MSIRVKAGKGIHIARHGDTIQLYSDPIPLSSPGDISQEADTTPEDFTDGAGVDPKTFTTWERQPGEPAATGIKLKMITRTYYDKDTDKNYNYYIILTFSNTGQLLAAEGESQEVAFETTLHEHNI